MMRKSDQQLLEQIKATCQEFCTALTDDEISRFIYYTRLRELGARDIIADIGAVTDVFYLVLGGAVNLYHVEGDKEFEVGHIDPGGLVGEMSFFDRQPRTVRLRARKSGARLLEVNRQMYNRIRIEEPYIATNLLEFVIRSLDTLVRYLSDENARLHKQLEGSRHL